MSAEVEAKDNVGEEEAKSLKDVVREQWQVGVKVLELLLCGAAMGFIYDPVATAGLGKSHLHHVGIMYTAYTGYMVINCVLLLSKVISDTIPYRTVAIFSLVGSALFLITCILLTVDRMQLMQHYFYHPNMYLLSMMTTSIVIAFINVVVMAADAAFTFVLKKDF